MARRIKKGDIVQVQSGKDKGREGKVIKVYPKENRALVEGVNMQKRHERSRRAGTKGSIVEVSLPVAASRLMLKCPTCRKAVRVSAVMHDDGKKGRACKRCGAEF